MPTQTEPPDHVPAGFQRRAFGLVAGLIVLLCSWCVADASTTGPGLQFSNWPVEGITAEQPEDPPPPELVPLPPALIPAAAVLGWVIYQRQRRRRA